MAPKKKTEAEIAVVEATQVSQQEKEQTAVTTTSASTTSTANAVAATGPSAPPNQAATVAQQLQINKNRLTRFTRPFQAGKKGGPQQVPPRVWRDDNNNNSNETDVALTEDGNAADNNNQQQQKSTKATPLITKELVEELTAKLGPIDLQRAAAKQDPIPVISTEAANLRSKRFHTETPQEVAAKRESRFEALTSSSSSAANGLDAGVPTVDGDAVARRESRWGVTLSQPAKTPVGTNSTTVLLKKDDKVVGKVELTEAEKRRLSRFQ